MKQRTRPLLLLLCVSMAVMTFAMPYSPVQAAPVEGFASPQIRAVWQHDDGPVASHSVARSWMWGPGPFYTDYEPYRETPEGNHLVQYFDKGRLEINDPNADPKSPWYVTSGLLVKEMIEGKVQTGNELWYDIGPAQIPVAGDTNANSPTYSIFAKLTNRVEERAGRPVTQEVSASGEIIQRMCRRRSRCRTSSRRRATTGPTYSGLMSTPRSGLRVSTGYTRLAYRSLNHTGFKCPSTALRARYLCSYSSAAPSPIIQLSSPPLR